MIHHRLHLNQTEYQREKSWNSCDSNSQVECDPSSHSRASRCPSYNHEVSPQFVFFGFLQKMRTTKTFEQQSESPISPNIACPLFYFRKTKSSRSFRRKTTLRFVWTYHQYEYSKSSPISQLQAQHFCPFRLYLLLFVRELLCVTYRTFLE